MSESDKSGKPELRAHECEHFLMTDVAVYACECDNIQIVDVKDGYTTEYVPKGHPDERSAAQARIAELETLISDMFDWCKCGYVHNSRMPVDRGLTILAKAKSIRDKKEVTPQDIRDWLH